MKLRFYVICLVAAPFGAGADSFVLSSGPNGQARMALDVQVSETNAGLSYRSENAATTRFSRGVAYQMSGGTASLSCDGGARLSTLYVDNPHGGVTEELAVPVGADGYVFDMAEFPLLKTPSDAIANACPPLWNGLKRVELAANIEFTCTPEAGEPRRVTGVVWTDVTVMCRRPTTNVKVISWRYRCEEGAMTAPSGARRVEQSRATKASADNVTALRCTDDAGTDLGVARLLGPNAAYHSCRDDAWYWSGNLSYDVDEEYVQNFVVVDDTPGEGLPADAGRLCIYPRG
ncbi:hypothetical protein [Celeribacter neptunius]|uniref:Uncharacterized protein n=1 Tax=Celeribacter neptunius TaxID=588602 RepID=A0A1I3W796_9RHOB|nr:hypothetical protein [Celeribacter neptunius]SFK02311.1 hypothetical protein SAMN04487991_3568 [Celeribacter neptunius]